MASERIQIIQSPPHSIGPCPRPHGIWHGLMETGLVALMANYQMTYWRNSVFLEYK